MLQIIDNIMVSVSWALVLPTVALMSIYVLSSPRTLRRYVAKSWSIVTVMVMTLLEIASRTIEMILYKGDSLMQGMTVFGCVFNVLIYTWVIKLLLSRDDDDWFNDKWKKLKRKVKNLRLSLGPRTVPVVP